MLTPGRLALLAPPLPAPPPSPNIGGVLVPRLGRRRGWLPPNPQIDWSHPLAQGIVLCLAATSQGGLVRLDAPQLAHKTNTSNMLHLRPGTGPFGPTVESNTAVNENGVPIWQYTTSLEGVPHSSLCVGNCRGGQVGGTLPTMVRCIIANGSTYGSANVGWISDSSVGYVRYGIGGPSFTAVTLTGTTTTVNDWFVGSMSSTAGSHNLWLNGRREATSTTNVMGTAGYGVNGLMNGGNPFDGQSCPGAVTLTAFWSRAFSPAEHAQLAADPFCFLKSATPQRATITSAALYRGWGIPL